MNVFKICVLSALFVLKQALPTVEPIRPLDPEDIPTNEKYRSHVKVCNYKFPLQELNSTSFGCWKNKAQMNSFDYVCEVSPNAIVSLWKELNRNHKVRNFEMIMRNFDAGTSQWDQKRADIDTFLYNYNNGSKKGDVCRIRGPDFSKHPKGGKWNPPYWLTIEETSEESSKSKQPRNPFTSTPGVSVFLRYIPPIDDISKFSVDREIMRTTAYEGGWVDMAFPIAACGKYELTENNRCKITDVFHLGTLFNCTTNIDYINKIKSTEFDFQRKNANYKCKVSVYENKVKIEEFYVNKDGTANLDTIFSLTI